jgi:putative transcriptional regulator
VKNRLQELRKAQGLSQSELARTLEISRQAVSGFESGKFTPSLEIALKIAQLLEVTVEEIFSSQEKNYMQTIIDKFTQWLPKGEKFTDRAIDVITIAREKAALCNDLEVEPKHILYGLLVNITTNIVLLKSSGLTFEVLVREIDLMLDSEIKNLKPINNVTKVERFSPESKYILELALQFARLKQSKYIKLEYLLLGLIQFVQLGNSNLDNLFQKVDVQLLQEVILKDEKEEMSNEK